MLGVNVSEWNCKVTVADCVVVVRKSSKFYSNMIPTVAMLVTYATLTVIMKQELTGARKISKEDHC